MENNKNKKSVKFQGDMLNFCDFIQVFVFTTNHHLNQKEIRYFFKKCKSFFQNIKIIEILNLLFEKKKIP